MTPPPPPPHTHTHTHTHTPPPPPPPPNQASEAQILRTSKSSSHMLVKQDWCETSGNFERKWPKTAVYDLFGARNDLK